ncbi:hypothetical protein Tco_0570030 [Tanacetum coccineum]
MNLCYRVQLFFKKTVFKSPNPLKPHKYHTLVSTPPNIYHTTHGLNNNANLPYLKKEEYETWAMKMKYWIMNSDHNLWNIVLNGNSRKRTGRDPKGNIMILPPVSVEEHIAMMQGIFGWLSKPDLEVAIHFLKNKGGLDYLRFDDLSTSLRTLEIDVTGGQVMILERYFLSCYPFSILLVRLALFKDVISLSNPIQQTFTSASIKSTASQHVMENVLHSFVVKRDPQQQDHFMKILIKFGLTDFEKESWVESEFNNKDAARFDIEEGPNVINAQSLGHFAWEMYRKIVDSKSKLGNRPSFVPADSRHKTTYVPAGSRNRPTSVHAGKTFSVGWKNNAARPMTKLTSHYFQHFHRPGFYNQMSMDEGRWGTAVKPSAENPHKNRDLGIVDSGYSRSMKEIGRMGYGLCRKICRRVTVSFGALEMAKSLENAL